MINIPCETLLLVLAPVFELSKSVSVDVLDLLPHWSFRQDRVRRRLLLRPWSGFTSHFVDFYPVHQAREKQEFKKDCMKLSSSRAAEDHT